MHGKWRLFWKKVVCKCFCHLDVNLVKCSWPKCSFIMHVQLYTVINICMLIECPVSAACWILWVWITSMLQTMTFFIMVHQFLFCVFYTHYLLNFLSNLYNWPYWTRDKFPGLWHLFLGNFFNFAMVASLNFQLYCQNIRAGPPSESFAYFHIFIFDLSFPTKAGLDRHWM